MDKAAMGRKVVIVSARTSGADLVRGIINGVKRDKPLAEAFFECLKEVGPALAAAVGPSFATAASEGFSNPVTNFKAATGAAIAAAGSVSASMLAKPPPAVYEFEDLVAVLESYISACQRQNLFPVLVIDEANLALPSPQPFKLPGDPRPEPPLTPEGERVRLRTVATLHLLTQLSKESKRLNVLLAASEHAEPFRLATLGYSTSHMTTVLVASEVPPADMRAMLVDKWRCGPRLAEGLLAVYGGHVLRAKNALGFLARDKAGFDAVSAFSPDALDGVIACRKAARSGAPAMAGFEGMLRELAERGFVALDDRTDPRAVVASFYNVGGVVLKSSFAPGVPPAAWGKRKVVLAASSQCMRLLLADELAQDPPPSAPGAPAT
jgi:hypothetical protein